MTVRQGAADRQQQRKRQQHQPGKNPGRAARPRHDGERAPSHPRIGFDVAEIIDQQHGPGQQAERQTGGERRRAEIGRCTANRCRTTAPTPKKAITNNSPSGV